jgi:hypothetical protein
MKTIIVILISIVILNHCKKEVKIPQRIIQPDENKLANVSFSLEKKAEVQEIDKPRIAVSKEEDRIYLYGKYTIPNKKGFIVKVYNKKLEFLSQNLFHYGQGPGDVGLTNVITPSDGNIYIFENSNMRISKFDNNFDYIDSFTMRKHAHPAELLENASFFIGCTFDFDEKDCSVNSFSIYSFPKFKRNKFFSTEPFSPRKKLEKGKFLLGEYTEYSYCYKNKSIYLLRCKTYRILRFDISGKKLSDTIVKVDEIKTNFKLEKKYLESMGYLKLQNRFSFSNTVTPTSWIVPLQKGFVVVRRKDYNAECAGLVEGDYFSYDVEFLGKVKIPCFSKIFQITGGMTIDSYRYENNYLYLINEAGEDYYVEKWKVHE